MKFSLGFWDTVFGKKIIIDYPNDDGTTRKINVTEKWFRKMEQRGQISVLPEVQIHMLNSDKLQVVTWFVGRDVSERDLEGFRDAATGDLYAMTFYKNGEPFTDLMHRDLWEYAAFQTGVATGISKQEMQKVKSRVEEFIISRGEKLPQLFSNEERS